MSVRVLVKEADGICWGDTDNSEPLSNLFLSQLFLPMGRLGMRKHTVPF
jgi:hypothetical protein